MLSRIKSINFTDPAFWFFIIFFVLGVLSFQDYGMGWDDEWSRTTTGYLNYNYIFNNDDGLLANNEKYHGPFVELALVFAEKISGLTDTMHVYNLRHFLLFLLFFSAVITFYYTLKEVFENPLSLLGCAMLVLSPRIYSEAFFNSKDLAFLSLFLISFYYYIKFVNSPTYNMAMVFGIISGALIDTRILGIMFPLLTIGYIFIRVLTNKLEKKSFLPLSIYIIITLIATFSFWPILWEGPIHHFSQAFIEMKKYHWDSHVFFNGRSIHASELPWYYLPVWIFITTPMVYMSLISLGILIFIRKLIINPITELLGEFEVFSAFALLSAPVLSVVILNSVVYDGWRHVFFIYPMLIIMSLYAINQATRYFRQYKYVKKYIYALVIANMIFISFWMINNHPHQNVYFNSLSLKKFEVDKKFELDYWGLSYKQALKYLANTIKSDDTITYTALNLPGQLNYMVLSKDERTKLKYVVKSDTSSWVYYLTNYRGSGKPENTELIHEILIHGTPIMGIYKRR